MGRQRTRALQSVCQLSRGRWTIRRKLFERAFDRVGDVLRNAGANRPRIGRSLGEHLGKDGLRGARQVRRVADQHLVCHRAQRIHVGARVDQSVTRRLLGPHVLRRADRHARCRDPRAAGVRDCQCDAEVGNQRLPLVQQDVLGLEIAVDHAVPVRVVQCAAYRDRDANCLVDRQLSLAIEPMAKALAIDDGHDVEQDSVGLPGVEQRQQVWVLQRRRDANLTQEPAPPRARRQARD